jgi:dienelactone hydrolase
LLFAAGVCCVLFARPMRVAFAVKFARVAVAIQDILVEDVQSPMSLAMADSVHAFIDSRYLEMEDERLLRDQNLSDEYLRQLLVRKLGLLDGCFDWNTNAVARELLYENEAYALHATQIHTCGHALVQHGLLAVPRTDEACPLVVALHGAAAGPEAVFDGWTNDLHWTSTRYDVSDYHNSMGSRLARSGFAVYAPQLITDSVSRPVIGHNQTRNELHMRLLPMGHTLHGIEISMIISALSAIENDSTIVFDREAVGAYGVSLGGVTAFMLAALDQRIRATVVSQWIEDRDEKTMGTIDNANWRHPNGFFVYSRGYARYFDDMIIFRLILPRAVFIEAGAMDGQRAQSALEEFQRWRETYGPWLQNSLQLAMEFDEDAGHEVLLNKSLGWLNRHLRKEQ